MEPMAAPVTHEQLGDFSQATDSLTRDYLVLQDQLAAVATELLHARRARVDELLAKERLAERLAQLLEIMPAAVLVTDADGIVIETNQAALDMLDRPLIGCTWSEVVARIAAPSTRPSGELRLDDGRFLSLSRRELTCDGGEMLLLTDITETLQLRDLVGQQHRLSSMGEMSARLAHQVRTPLAAALLCLSQLDAMRIELPPDAQKYVNRSLRRLGDLSSLIDDMLIFAKGRPTDSEDFDLAAVLNEAVASVEAMRGDTPIRMTIDGSATVTGAPRAVSAAIANLLSNALEYTASGTSVDVRLTCRAGEARVSVRDYGPGVPVEFQDRVFEPFFSTRSQGTGLGLAVVETVTSAHGGRVGVRDLGDGAEFVIALPMAEERGARQ